MWREDVEQYIDVMTKYSTGMPTRIAEQIGPWQLFFATFITKTGYYSEAGPHYFKAKIYSYTKVPTFSIWEMDGHQSILLNQTANNLWGERPMCKHPRIQEFEFFPPRLKRVNTFNYLLGEGLGKVKLI